MNIRLNDILEKKLNYYAHELHTTKTELVRPYIIRLLEDLEDYYNATEALKEPGSISLADLEKELDSVEN